MEWTRECSVGDQPQLVTQNLSIYNIFTTNKDMWRESIFGFGIISVAKKDRGDYMCIHKYTLHLQHIF